MEKVRPWCGCGQPSDPGRLKNRTVQNYGPAENILFSRFELMHVQCSQHMNSSSEHVHSIRYDTRCYFNVRSKADISQLNLPHGTDN